MKRVIPVVIAVVIIVGLILAGFRFMGTVYAETKGVAYSTHGVKGNSAANGCPIGDVLDTDTYITGWTGTADSEKIVVAGAFSLTADLWREVEVKRTWYQITLEGSGPDVKINGVPGMSYISEKSTAPSQDVGPDRFYFMPSFTFKLTNPFVGKIHAEFWADRQWNFGMSGGAAKLSEDEAYLKSGIGRIYLTAPAVEEGTDCVFNVETGYAHSSLPHIMGSADEGWFLNIYDPSGTMIWQKIVSDNFYGQVTWPVPLGSWKSEWNNRFTAVLRNELIDQDQRVTTIIEVGGMLKKPNFPVVTVLKGSEPFEKGESITLRLSAEQNPLGYPVAGFIVSIVATSATGAVTDFIIKDAYYPSLKGTGSTYFADVSFSFPEAGYAELWGSTVDTHNLASGDVTLKFSVTGMGPPPPDEPPGFNLWIIAAVGAILFSIVVGVLLIRKFFPWGMVVGAIFLGGAAVGLWYLWTVML